LNQKKAKRLRREAKQKATTEMVPDDGYQSDEKKSYLYKNKEVIMSTINVHPGTRKGIYKQLKKEAKAN